MPAYRRLSMPRKRPQVLGGDLNRSEASHSLISHDFFPKSDTNGRSRRTLRNKSFFTASDTTATKDEHARGVDKPGGYKIPGRVRTNARLSGVLPRCRTRRRSTDGIAPRSLLALGLGVRQTKRVWFRHTVLSRLGKCRKRGDLALDAARAAHPSLVMHCWLVSS